MSEELKILGEKLLEQKFEIARRVHEKRFARREKQQKSSAADKEIIELRAAFIGMFGNLLIEQPDKAEAEEVFLKWGKETGKKAYFLGFSLDEALKRTTYYRTYIWEVLGEEMTKKAMSLETSLKANALLNPLLDQAAYAFSSSYVQFHEETLERARKAFLELSLPVVPITRGLAVLPLIGNVDTERARLLLEEVLQKASTLQLSHLLFDLSGVPVIDTMVADQIFKVEKALSLIGVETVFIGIRPEVAQTMVSLGIDMSNLKIKANLEQALKELQKANELFS